MKREKPKNSSSEGSLYRYYSDQSWSCLGCGKCCTMWDIPVTREEKERLEKLDIPGFDFANEAFFLPMKHHSGLFLIKKRDDKCIFLDTDGLCIIHKLHGEAVKALACRLYPFHILKWNDGTVSASFRFDCTAVSQNHGVKITRQKGKIATFVPELEKSGRKSTASYTKQLQPALSKLREIAALFKEILFHKDSALHVRLYYAARMVDFYAMPEHREYIMNADSCNIADSIAYLEEHEEEFEYVVDSADPVDKLMNMIFNYILSGYARVDEETGSGFLFSGRLMRARSVLLFITGKGSLKTLSCKYPDTKGVSTLESLENAVLEWDAKQVIQRYIGVQLDSMHFCGNPGLDLTFEEGIRHLILFIPVTVAVASLHAAVRQSTAPGDKIFVSLEDMTNALRITDHTFYHSPFFKLRHVKKMEKWLLSEKKFPSLLQLLK